MMTYRTMRDIVKFWGWDWGCAIPTCACDSESSGRQTSPAALPARAFTGFSQGSQA